MENLNLNSSCAFPNKIGKLQRGNLPLHDTAFVNEYLTGYVLYSNKIHLVHSATLAVEILNLPKEIPSEEEIIYLQYSRSRHQLLIATNSHLISYDFRETQFAVHKVNLNSNIIKVSWSPLLTMLVVITEDERLYTFTIKHSTESNEYSFYIRKSNSLNAPVPNSAYVGWGSQNSQFKGLKKNKELIKEITQEYEKPHISWRKNGEMFIVNYCCEKKRVLKLFNDHCVAMHMTEGNHHKNMLPPVAFRSAGNSIMTCSFDGTAHSIMITEKNCLLRSKMPVPDIEGKVKYMKSHPDIPLLAIQSGNSKEERINIYYHANETWYLKQQINFPYASKEYLVTFCWDEDSSKESVAIYVLTTEYIRTYKYFFGLIGAAHQMVLVINGCDVNFTCFQNEARPPPLASRKLTFKRPINGIQYDEEEDNYIFLTADTDIFKLSFSQLMDNVSPLQVYNCKKKGANNDMRQFIKHINKAQYKVELCEGRLQFNGQTLFDNVLSIYVTQSYLLFVKVKGNDCRMHCMRLKDITLYNSFTLEQAYSRPVEHGAQIIAICNRQIVLLMPRGNLELVTCRLIDLDILEDFIVTNKWEEAITLVKNEKLDWNVLIDISPFLFNQNIAKFIDAADRYSVVNTILSELRKANCLSALYSFWLPDRSPRQQLKKSQEDSSVDKEQIFEELVISLTSRNPVKYITGVVKLQINHFGLTPAMITILEVYLLGAQYHSACRTGLKTVLQAKDLKECISVTASLFNLSFMEFVFDLCAEDPLQYKTELAELRKLEQENAPLARAQLCLRANMLGMATKYFLRDEQTSPKFITAYIQRHQTAKAAYEMLPFNHKLFKLVSQLYAMELSVHRHHKSAGMVLERAGLLKDAVRCYKLANMWTKTMELMSRFDMPEDRKRELFRSLAKLSSENGQGCQAAHMLEKFVKDNTAACEVLVQHHEFYKAILLLRNYDREADIETLIKPPLKEYCQLLSNQLSENIENIVKMFKRLKDVRYQKISALVARQSVNEGYELDEGDEDFDMDSDVGSLASSSFRSGSSASQGSTASSRNRRKLERKKIDLKPGGTYEDIAIIRHLHMTINQMMEVGENIFKVCNLILDEEHYKRASKLQSQLQVIYDGLGKIVSGVWSDVFLKSEITTEPHIWGVIENRSEIDPEFLVPPNVARMAEWLISIYPTSPYA